MYVKTSGQGMGCDERDRGWGVGGEGGGQGGCCFMVYQAKFYVYVYFILVWYNIALYMYIV